MSEQRWAVIRDAPRNGWAVIHPGDAFRGRDGLLECWDVHSRHGTWAEAMRYADEQARAITVTLPANPDAVLPVTTVDAYNQGDSVWIERTYRVAWDWDATIPDAYRETVALALLAHARKDHS